MQKAGPQGEQKSASARPRQSGCRRILVLGTSLPAEDYPAQQVLSAYRLRWQIELAFKRLKSLLRIDRLPTHSERGSRSWLYAHLILALLCDEISRNPGIFPLKTCSNVIYI